MSKKDNNKSSNFNDPFSQLRGLSVSSQKKAPEVEKPTHAEVLSEVPAVPVDEEEQFAQAMGQLGVAQTITSDALLKASPSTQTTGGETLEITQQTSEGHCPVGSRRQVRKAAKRMGEPEVTLDLHGVAAVDVTRKVDWFLENAIFHGCRYVRIVTGKGSHSDSGPVLKPLIESHLSGPGRRFVVTWVPAPRDQGGDGALLVELYGTEDVDP